MGIPNFYLSQLTTNYDFGPSHPLRPERLRRAMRLLQAIHPTEVIEPAPASESDLQRVHSAEYVEAVKEISAAFERGEENSPRIGDLIGKHSLYGDTPAFRGIWETSAAYCGASLEAAYAVRDGAPLAFAIGGGLHHAHRNSASGFCVFDDPALAVSVLRERFDRVVYIDIDVHHGDGVQGIFLNDPNVLTYSIHESGKSLWPGTGYVEETGTAGTSTNMPVLARTSGPAWVDAFERTALPTMERFQPQALVLQMGTDPHFLDPLAHVNCDQASWLSAVRRCRDLGIPTVAVGGGGYSLHTVPRMWVSAILTLSRVEFDDAFPADLAAEWGVQTFSDAPETIPHGLGIEANEPIIRQYLEDVLPGVPAA